MELFELPYLPRHLKEIATAELIELRQLICGTNQGMEMYPRFCLFALPSVVLLWKLVAILACSRPTEPLDNRLQDTLRDLGDVLEKISNKL
jgi:hypothetical protein